MTSPGPTHRQSDLAEMIEMLLDKGVVINADVVVSVGDTELLGVHIRAAIASFETAAEYGLAFPEGTDMNRVEAAVERSGGGDRRVEAGEGRNVTEQLKLGPPGDGWQEEYAKREDEESEEAEATAPEATGGGDDGG